MSNRHSRREPMHDPWMCLWKSVDFWKCPNFKLSQPNTKMWTMSSLYMYSTNIGRFNVQQPLLFELFWFFTWEISIFVFLPEVISLVWIGQGSIEKNVLCASVCLPIRIYRYLTQPLMTVGGLFGCLPMLPGHTKSNPIKPHPHSAVLDC